MLLDTLEIVVGLLAEGDCWLDWSTSAGDADAICGAEVVSGVAATIPLPSLATATSAADDLTSPACTAASVALFPAARDEFSDGSAARVATAGEGVTLGHGNASATADIEGLAATALSLLASALAFRPEDFSLVEVFPVFSAVAVLLEWALALLSL
jgi:hypothetical protein